VFAVGTWPVFVTHGETGFIQPGFDAGEWADALIALDKNRSNLKPIGEAARTRISTLCDGPCRASDVVQVWRQALEDASKIWWQPSTSSTHFPK
jgi:hypothetical protein